MVITAVDIFLIVGGVIDEFLDVDDIIARMLTCKQVHDEPSEAAETVMWVSAYLRNRDVGLGAPGIRL